MQLERQHPAGGAAEQHGAGAGPAGGEGEAEAGLRGGPAAEEGTAGAVPPPLAAQEEDPGPGTHGPGRHGKEGERVFGVLIPPSPRRARHSC